MYFTLKGMDIVNYFLVPLIVLFCGSVQHTVCMWHELREFYDHILLRYDNQSKIGRIQQKGPNNRKNNVREFKKNQCGDLSFPIILGMLSLYPKKQWKSS